MFLINRKPVRSGYALCHRRDEDGNVQNCGEYNFQMKFLNKCSRKIFFLIDDFCIFAVIYI